VAPAGDDAVEEWSADRLDALASLCERALPEEPLLAEDLEAVCFGSPGDPRDALRRGASVVLGVDEAAAVAVSCAELGDRRSAHVQLLVVDPARRHRGLARRLLAAAAAWSGDQGADALHLGGGAPFYLFTGIDTRWTDALCAAEALGFEREGVELDLVCPTRAQHPSQPEPTGSDRTSVRSVVSDDDVEDLLAFAARHWPLWSAELRRAATTGTAVVARDPDGEVQGAAAHSVSRLGVIGPVAVRPDRQGAGVGAALMRQVLSDLSVAGFDRAEIAWTTTVRFYARACGARVGRASVVMRRPLRAAPDRR
jgi:GNAT superfamily N-acetyltransferase